MSIRRANRENPRSLGRALARHWRLAGMVFTAVSLLTLWAVLAWPRMYESQARLVVQFHSEGDGGQNPDTEHSAVANTIDPLSPDQARQVEALVAGLQSAEVLGRVLTASGTVSESQKNSAQEAAVTQLLKRVQIASLPATNLIELRCRATSATAAQSLASRLVAVCLDHGVKASAASVELAARRAKEGERSKERQRLRAEAEATAARLTAERQSADAVALDGKRREVAAKSEQAQTELAGIRSDLTAADERIAQLEQAIAALAPPPPAAEPPAPSATSDEARQDMQASLLELETLERQLAATRADNHPQLVAVRQQLADLRRTLAQQPVPSVDRQPAPHPGEPAAPSREALVRDLQIQRSRAAVLRGKESELVAAADRLRGELSQLDSQSASLANHLTKSPTQPRPQSADPTLLEPVANDAVPANHPIWGLSVAVPPTLPAGPLGPPPGRTIALGLSLALTSALASALWAARRTPVVSTALDVERMWDLPLAGVVPPVDLALATAS